MILLDTNVVSELMKVQPAETVLAWLNGQPSDKLYLSAVTIGAIAYGLRVLPDGKRRSGLRERFERFVALAFDQRVLSYDESAGRIYAELTGDRKELGRKHDSKAGTWAQLTVRAGALFHRRTAASGSAEGIASSRGATAPGLCACSLPASPMLSDAVSQSSSESSRPIWPIGRDSPSAPEHAPGSSP